MPKMEGRESTARKFELELLLVDSFHPHGARWIPRMARCCVKGCDHRVNACLKGAAGVGRAVVQHSVNERLDSGWICSCCLAKVMGDQGMLDDPPFDSGDQGLNPDGSDPRGGPPF